MIRGDALTEKSDAWSVGCILYELMSNKPAFRGSSQQNITDNLKNDSVPGIYKESTYSQHLKHIVTKCLVKDPNLRMGISDILKLPFIERFMASKNISGLKTIRKRKTE